MKETILVTGGTGSFGQAMTRFLLEHTDATVRIYSRCELKQAEMAAALGESRVRYLLGDVRDADRLSLAMRGVHRVFHAAALKHVPAGEYTPDEFVKTNIGGTQRVIQEAIRAGVENVVFLSTDKGVNPVNLYGATKMTAERLIVRANSYSPQGTRFSVVRYGNVAGSRGSVIPLWRHALATGGQVRLTTRDMTRFWITLDDAIRLAWFASCYGPRGGILVPHLQAFDVATLLAVMLYDAGRDVDVETTGIRPGEKVHEELLTADEAQRVVVYQDREKHDVLYYCVPPMQPSWAMPEVAHWRHPKTATGMQWAPEPLALTYRSDDWPWRMDAMTIRQALQSV